MKPLVISEAAAIACLDAITRLLDQGDGVGRLRIYAGQPGPQSATMQEEAGVVLAEIELDAVAFKAARPVDGQAISEAASFPKKVRAIASGTASYFRAFDGDGAPVVGGSVATARAAMVLDTVRFIEHQAVEVAHWQLSMPYG